MVPVQTAVSARPSWLKSAAARQRTAADWRVSTAAPTSKPLVRANGALRTGALAMPSLTATTAMSTLTRWA